MNLQKMASTQAIGVPLGQTKRSPSKHSFDNFKSAVEQNSLVKPNNQNNVNTRYQTPDKFDNQALSMLKMIDDLSPIQGINSPQAQKAAGQANKGVAQLVVIVFELLEELNSAIVRSGSATNHIKAPAPMDINLKQGVNHSQLAVLERNTTSRLGSTVNPVKTFTPMDVNPQQGVNHSKSAVAERNETVANLSTGVVTNVSSQLRQGEEIPKPIQDMTQFQLGAKPVNMGGDGSASDAEIQATKHSMLAMYQQSPTFRQLIDQSSDALFEISVGRRPDNTSWGNADGRVFININNLTPGDNNPFQTIVAHEMAHAAGDLGHGNTLNYIQRAVATEA